MTDDVLGARRGQHELTISPDPGRIHAAAGRATRGELRAERLRVVPRGVRDLEQSAAPRAYGRGIELGDRVAAVLALLHRVGARAHIAAPHEPRLGGAIASSMHAPRSSMRSTRAVASRPCARYALHIAAATRSPNS